jgi:xanthine/uracil permease
VTVTRTEPLHYNLDDRPPGLKLWLYTLQFLAFSVANSAVVPVVVGTALGLDAAGIASLVQRTFFFCALGSLLQVWLGHGYPIFEGPAGVCTPSSSRWRASPAPSTSRSGCCAPTSSSASWSRAA